MEDLVRTVGKAPSELTVTELVGRLEHERARVRRAMDEFRGAGSAKGGAKPKPSRAKPAKTEAGQAMQQALAEMGLTLKDARELLKKGGKQ